MNLPSDMINVILGKLDNTSLMVCKFTCKSLHEYVQTKYPTLTWNIYEIIYKDYFHLFTKYLIPLFGEPRITDSMKYTAGLGYSTKFIDIFENMEQPSQSFMEGVFRSGNLDYVKALPDHINYLKFPLIFVLRSMSIPIVNYITSRYNIIQGRVKLISLLQDNSGRNKLELSLGLKIDVELPYIDYLLERSFLDLSEIASDAIIMNDNQFINYSVSKGYKPTDIDLMRVIENNNIELAKLIVSLNPAVINTYRIFSTSSLECYMYIKECNLRLDSRDCLTLAVSKGNKELIAHIYEDGHRFTDQILLDLLDRYTYSKPKITSDILRYLMSLGYQLPPNIYTLLASHNSLFNMNLFNLFHELGYKDESVLPYLCDFTDVNVVKTAINLGYPINDSSLHLKIINKDKSIEVFDCLIVNGYKAPDYICDMLFDNIPLLRYFLGIGYKVSQKALLSLISRAELTSLHLIIDYVVVEKETIIHASLLKISSDKVKSQIMTLLLDAYTKNH